MIKKNTILKKNIFLTLVIVFSVTIEGFSQIEKSDWVKSSNKKEKVTAKKFLKKLPTSYATWNISISNFSNKMRNTGAQEIVLPSPSGKLETFVIKPSNVIANEVAHLYTIKTFIGYKKDEPSTIMSCDISNDGFHAAVYKSNKSYFIEPLYKANQGTVITYYKKDNAIKKIQCNTTGFNVKKQVDISTKRSSTPTTKSTYRIAIAASGEYSQQFGGSPVNTTTVLNSLASGVNLMNPIYLRDLGVQLTLVSNAALVYPDPDTDPFDTINADNLPDDAHAACVSALTVNGFDVGHAVIWDNIGGVAGKGVVCFDMDKGAGYSGSDSSLTTLWIDYVCHEVGHQFGSEHNFVSEECATSVDGFRYEPGEGSSIMAYANVCGPPVQYAIGADPFFHYASIKQIQDYILTEACETSDASGNTSDPVAQALADITIPKETPFILVGNGSDANDPVGNLTYDWAQYDGASTAVSGLPDCMSTDAPLFRYRSPSTDNYRSFPQSSDVIAGNNDQAWEKLPCVPRTMNFSLTVRDNNTSFGRIAEDKTVVTVANTGPFNVTSPNGGEVFDGNTAQTVTWTVNGTNAHCANVDILISTDGGNTYTVIANATANDGTESITIPDVNITTARILVSCDVTGDFRSASTFYDVSDANFTVNQSLSITDFEALGINIYPNPASKEVFIKLNKEDDYSYRLVDIRGRRILNDTFKNTTRIETTNLQTGVYFLQLHQERTNLTVVKKLIIQN